MLRRAVLVMAMVAFGAAGAAPARADQVPANCNTSGLGVSISRQIEGQAAGATIVRPGDVIDYRVSVRNDNVDVAAGEVACDITNATVTLAPPGPDGLPSATPIALGTPNQPFAGGMLSKPIQTVGWPVEVDPTKLVDPATGKIRTDLVARAASSGTLHDTPNNVHPADISKNLGTEVTIPSLKLTKTGSTIGGVAPQTVTYTYTLTNTSQTVVPIGAVHATDNLCAPLTLVGGDANANSLLENSETWTFTCTKTYVAAGCYTNIASATGTSTVDNRPVPANQAQWMVCVTAPPAPPQGNVKGASVVKPSPKACVTLASTRLHVRAKELNTVKVRVRLSGKNIAKSKVTVTGPAGLKRTGVTNSKGMVTFSVRPKKSGRLTIQSDQCTVKARVSVKPARQVVSPVLPEVTG